MRVDLLGVDLLGVDLLGVDLLGVGFMRVGLVGGHPNKQLPSQQTALTYQARGRQTGGLGCGSSDGF